MTRKYVFKSWESRKAIENKVKIIVALLTVKLAFIQYRFKIWRYLGNPLSR